MKSEVLEVDIGLLTAAHELKSPLSLLRQLALSLDLPTTNPQKATSQMIRISDQALSQIDDLLRVARLEDALFTLEPINPRIIITALPTENLHIKIKNRHPLAIGNRILLTSIINNFVSNARKFDSRPTLTLSDHHQKLRISVRDHGPALPVQIFRAINQNQIAAPLPTPLRPSSSGLGLFISTRFARHMHAQIVATRHRDGTSFHLDLPISRQLSLC